MKITEQNIVNLCDQLFGGLRDDSILIKPNLPKFIHEKTPSTGPINGR